MAVIQKSLGAKKVLLLSVVAGLLVVTVALFAHREAGAAVALSQHMDPDFFAQTGPQGLACANCHNDYPLITISELGDAFTIDDCGGNMGRQCAGLFTDGYVPGQLYQMRAIISYAGMSSWGFDLWVRDENGATAGTLGGQQFRSAIHNRVQDGMTVRAVSNEGVGYRHNGVYDGPVGWRFSWRAPDSNIGPIRFFAEGTAADRDRTPRGDYSYYLDGIVVNPAADTR